MAAPQTARGGQGPAPDGAVPDSAGAEAQALRLEDKLYLNRWKSDDRSHLIVMDQEICLHRCGETHNHACTIFCPAGVYKFEGDMVSVMYEGCLECGACRMGCPYHNIEWHFPRGGYGVTYKYG